MVPLFPKSDKKWRRYWGELTRGWADLEITIRYNATIHEKMPPGGSQIGKSATPLHVDDRWDIIIMDRIQAEKKIFLKIYFL